MINKDDIIVTKDELYLQQAPSLNFELDADELLEKALLRGFVEKVGDDKYKINNDYSGSQE
jgi:chemotaxis methyl-accepting protein methylase